MENWLDIVIIFTTLVVGFLGWRMGAVRTFAVAAGAAGGAYFASQHKQWLATYVGEVISNSQVSEVLSFAAIAVGVFITSVLIGRILHRVLRLFFIGWLDRASGGVIGLGVTLALWLFALGTLTPLAGPKIEEFVALSYIAQFMADHGPQLVVLLPQPVQEFVEGAGARISILEILGRP